LKCLIYSNVCPLLFYTLIQWSKHLSGTLPKMSKENPELKRAMLPNSDLASNPVRYLSSSQAASEERELFSLSSSLQVSSWLPDPIKLMVFLLSALTRSILFQHPQLLTLKESMPPRSLMILSNARRHVLDTRAAENSLLKRHPKRLSQLIALPTKRPLMALSQRT